MIRSPTADAHRRPTAASGSRNFKESASASASTTPETAPEEYGSRSGGGGVGRRARLVVLRTAGWIRRRRRPRGLGRPPPVVEGVDHLSLSSFPAWCSRLPLWSALSLLLLLFILLASTVAAAAAAARVFRRRRALSIYLEPSSGFHPEWHPARRADRFPSVEERVKLYMSNWYYVPPCPGEDSVAGLGEKGRNGDGSLGDGFVTYRYRYDKADGDDEGDTAAIRRRRDGPRTAKVVVVDINSPYADPPPGPHHPPDQDGNSTLAVGSIRPDYPLVLRRDSLTECAKSNARLFFDTLSSWAFGSRRGADGRSVIVARKNMRPYCRDSIDAFDLLAALDYASSIPAATTDTAGKDPLDMGTPLVAQYGDASYFRDMPMLTKFRKSSVAYPSSIDKVATNDKNDGGRGGRDCLRDVRSRTPLEVHPGGLGRNRYAPIVWKLESSRHFGMLDGIPLEDSSWETKKAAAVFRGRMTGGKRLPPGASPKEICSLVPRCKLVLDAHDGDYGDILDAKLTGTFGIVPDVVGGVPIVGGALSRRELLRHRAVVMLQGNDVASGFKWALFSRSVVLTTVPTVTSWAMEEALVPWVHYVPLRDDLSDAEEKVRWVIERSDEARKIAERATLFLYDLVFHPDASRDDVAVKEEILRRYRQFFRRES